VRSYSWVDHLFITKYFGDKETVWIEQKLGRISVTFISQLRPSSRRAIWHQSDRLENEIPYPTRNALGFGIRRFGEDTGEPGFDLNAPHWFYASVVAFVAAVTWVPGRFSLRALLIVTTVVAVVLGLVVYTSRK
jgi:hypothetical protein